MKKYIVRSALIAAAALAVTPVIGAQVGAQVGAGAGVQAGPVGVNAETAAGANVVVDDREVTLRVKAALSKDKELAALGLAVKATAGNVELSGSARTNTQAARAVEIVRSVPGVKSVKSEIRVS